MIILSSYYRGGWATAYCETGLAQWVFVFAWVGMGAVIYQFLINVWFWRWMPLTLTRVHDPSPNSGVGSR